jgi:hypothetical protein
LAGEAVWIEEILQGETFDLGNDCGAREFCEFIVKATPIAVQESLQWFSNLRILQRLQHQVVEDAVEFAIKDELVDNEIQDDGGSVSRGWLVIEMFIQQGFVLGQDCGRQGTVDLVLVGEVVMDDAGSDLGLLGNVFDGYLAKVRPG